MLCDQCPGSSHRRYRHRQSTGSARRERGEESSHVRETMETWDASDGVNDDGDQWWPRLMSPEWRGKTRVSMSTLLVIILTSLAHVQGVSVDPDMMGSNMEDIPIQAESEDVFIFPSMGLSPLSLVRSSKEIMPTLDRMRPIYSRTAPVIFNTLYIFIPSQLSTAVSQILAKVLPCFESWKGFIKNLTFIQNCLIFLIFLVFWTYIFSSIVYDNGSLSDTWGRFCDNDRIHKHFLKLLSIAAINNRVLIVNIQSKGKGIASVVCRGLAVI